MKKTGIRKVRSKYIIRPLRPGKINTEPDYITFEGDSNSISFEGSNTYLIFEYTGSGQSVGGGKPNTGSTPQPITPK